ncbi:MAG: glycoside hydrolase family 18 [Prevotella sp.]|nr:glycoside hydrolase family 18 [Prevotella sp.]MDD7460882.1 glycoside hydrolase family 18 [Prevotellaceae bacterium]MDY3365450.1 glycoside hydrolase family 18 [Prevotella sp.]
MKLFKYYTFLLALSAGFISSCSDMVEVENKPYDHIGGYNTMNNEKSEQYYADLREYKKSAINYGRPVAFGWFSNWSPAGTYRRGYLSSMPDSMDIVSMWSGAPNRFTITPEQKADKEFVQKVKGTKLLEVSLLSYIGKGRTPDYIYQEVEKKAEAEGWAKDAQRVEEAKKLARWKFWGYDGVHGSDSHKAALAKFAKALCDSLIVNEWDGYDIDWEIGSGVFDMDGTLSSDADLIYLVKEMNKYIGPMSDPDNKGHKLICIDGHFRSLTKELDGYVDYWIDQTYGRTPYFEGYGYGTDPKKVIVTENFESYFVSGGRLLEQAASMPSKGYKGGVGAYRFDNDYDNAPNYKWMRQAIQINQQVFQQWKEEQTQASEDTDN